ncbi:hypothetical protein [Methanobacterium spitsbergense]|uniref:Uncharacterized protein n=1 Tax=Methanobacterium spitsbergense TaxID=2874285 RepID=A0A8T5URF5_9EURY|nr:hypothetical protein [Methanobacterium spitsbergense]MBZ2166348.1 hypothetical protein [Methanobacterium spitsbergense]
MDCRCVKCEPPKIYAKHKIWAVDNPSNISFPLLDTIKTALEKQIYLKAKDIKRIVFSYTDESDIYTKEHCRAQIQVTISKNAFFIGNIEQDKHIPNLGIMWIGKTRYEIWRGY